MGHSSTSNALRWCANFLQNATVSVWLYEQLSIRIEGKIRVSAIPNQATLQNDCAPASNFDRVSMSS